MDRAVELYMEELRKVQPLTEEEKNTLPQRLREKNSDAQKQMAELHLEMVVTIAQFVPTSLTYPTNPSTVTTQLSI